MKPFNTGHEDLVHDIQYDFYGKHIATASSDQHIKVFDLDPYTGSCILNDLWKAHDSLIVKLSWAHPEFCSTKLLASCSYDRTVKLWQESPDELHGLGRRWVKLATLAVESYGPIYDVVFAPKHLGLKLGCIGLDGVFRIYEAVEPSDLSIWQLTTEIPFLEMQLPEKNLQSAFALEWCPTKFASREMFIVIAIDQCYIYGSNLNQSSNAQDSHGYKPGIDNLKADDVDSSKSHKYVKLCKLPEHNGIIRSVSWAPSMGRKYHLIATGCKDGKVRIFKVVEVNGELTVELVASLKENNLQVWKVSWNLTGTILSSAGDDGKVRLWKSNYLNEWKCMSVVDSMQRDLERTKS